MAEERADAHDCLREGDLHYRAHYAAPGYGEAWECVCGKGWAKIGATFFDPCERVHELTPEDVI